MPVAARQDRYSSHFEALAARRAAEPAWLRTLRQTAFDQFVHEGFPTTRDEEWRFTNIGPLVDTAFAVPGTPSPATPELIAPFGFSGLDAITVAVLDGRIAPALCDLRGLPDGAFVGTLGAPGAPDEAAERHLGAAIKFPQQGFTALNTALFADLVFIHLAPGTTLDRPVHVLHVGGLTRSAAAHPRLLVVAEELSAVTVVESYAGPAETPYLTNAVSEFVCGQSSVVTHYRVQRESLAAGHVASMHVRLGVKAAFSSRNLVFGGATARSDINAVLEGERGTCTLDGLYLVDARRLVDNHTTIDHAMPHCESHELYKGVLDGHGRGVFNGKIFVRLDAQKTDAKQTNQVLLLSDDATINTKPQLEIFADDVKCTHGATVGQLDEQALFYLRARGIGRDEARAMLIHAFAEDIIERIELEPVRAALEAELLSRLPKS